MQAKGRVLWRLMIAFLIYYFALLIGAAYYRPLFSLMVTSNLNFGMFFALSQYLFAGAIALFYAYYMKKIDASMADVIDTQSAK
jgi:uncharacterized membrane protein (DUF485 family)